LQKLFSHTFSQHIWRILPHADPHRNEWVLELREITEKKVSIAFFDLYNGELKWTASPPGLDWWTSITGFAHDFVFLHHYRYPEIPEPTDLSAVSAESGHLLWTLPNYVLVKALESPYIRVARKDGQGFRYETCNAETGLIVEGEYVDEFQTEIILKEAVRYKAGNVYFARLSSFLQTNFYIENPVCIDYLDCRPFMVFSYYIYEQDKVAQYLLITTSKKEIVLQEKLSEGRDGIGESTILLKGSTLVYLKNNTEFRSLKLSQ
jgi:hypothetical protein